MYLPLFIESVKYITSAPFFWGSMGFTSAIALFAGVAIYDGHLNQVKKALISVLSFASVILWFTASRVLNTLSIANNEPHPERPIGSIISIGFITVAWVFGVLLGVFIFRKKYRKGV